ncbi:MAG: hypothetical protein L6R40_006064 [Gallowayella cf. fulva]|nr:MAG: hypothetical protein L6R40_006064 [Xanthomendoza cf. fulva]
MHLAIDDYLFWLFTKSLNGEKDQQQISGLANVSQEMETLITKKQEEKKRLSWRLIRSISDIAVIAEMQRQMGLSTCNDYSLSAYSEEDNNAWMSARMKPFLDILNVLIDHDELEPLVESLRAFDYPVEKPRTAAITARLQSAERALDKLWAGLDELFIRKTCKSLEELGGNTFKYRNLQRTLDWTVPYSEKSDRKSTDDVDASLALILLEERTESTLVQSQVSGARHKTKTRGSTVQADSTEPKPHTAANATGISFLRLTVRKKAFNTFAAVFGLPIADSLPGEVPWNDFKKAMVNVGFSAEKLQGSGWLFKPADSPSLGLSSIIFHEPHPESKMPMQVARRIARRLKRDFGWTADTFVTEQAVSE